LNLYKKIIARLPVTREPPQNIMAAKKKAKKKATKKKAKKRA
jgi:hypothetical protein